MSDIEIHLNAGGGGEKVSGDLIAGKKHLRVKMQSGIPGEVGDVSYLNPMYTAPANAKIAEGLVPGKTMILRFGRDEDIDTASTPEDIWEGDGVYTGFPAEVETIEVLSSDSNDTAAGSGARTVELSDLQDGSGNMMPNVVVSLDGVTPVSAGAQTYSRGFTAKVITAGATGENEGVITVRHSSTTANVFSAMSIGANETSICAYTVPLGHVLDVFHIDMNLSRASGAAGSANVSLRKRYPGEVFQSLIHPTLTEAHGYSLDSGYIFTFPALTDVVLRVDSVSDNNTIINGEITGILTATP